MQAIRSAWLVAAVITTSCGTATNLPQAATEVRTPTASPQAVPSATAAATPTVNTYAPEPSLGRIVTPPPAIEACTIGPVNGVLTVIYVGEGARAHCRLVIEAYGPGGANGSSQPWDYTAAAPGSQRICSMTKGTLTAAVEDSSYGAAYGRPMCGNFQSDGWAYAVN